ncbi:MAG: gliding motility protein GldL [Bacteroidales bacterium]|nr:gliding motility protein GldL [Bacteroidales bacterium]
MGKYKGFKNRIEKFFSGEDGQRFLNVAYCIGASVVIIGTLFEILHLRYGDIILCIGMGTEAFIFALSAFDKPAENYKWEDVFPVLKSDDKTQRPDFSSVGKGVKNQIVVNQHPVVNGSNNYNSDYNAAQTNQQPQINNQGSYSTNQTDDNYSSKNVNAGASQFSGVPFTGSVNDLSQATDRYLQQLNDMAEQMERLKQITEQLNNVQGTLLNSYSVIADNSENINSFSEGYVSQMESLNKNINGLNTIYEIQLKSVSSQLDTIDKVNSGLSSIRSMYDNSTLDSVKIRQETEKMTDNLAQLNKVYERMLSAMTVNMQNPLSGH